MTQDRRPQSAERPSEHREDGAEQHQRFKELARELGCDEDEAAFDAALKKVAERAPLPKHEPKKRKPKGA
jgi:hypothetical protein